MYTYYYSHLPLGVERLRGGGSWRVQLHDAERLEASCELDLAAVHGQRLVALPHEAVAVRHDAHLNSRSHVTRRRLVLAAASF